MNSARTFNLTNAKNYMGSNVKNTFDIDSLTERHKEEILGFLEIRRRLENMRMNGVLGLALICGTTLIFNQIDDSTLKTWQTVLICISIALFGISERVIYRVVSDAKTHLIDLGLPLVFVQTLAKVNIRKMDKELAARKAS